MTQPDYEQKKCECLQDFCKEHGFIETADVKGIFGYAFDRAHALGKLQASCGQVKETITQEEIEKMADKFADEIRIPASLPGVMVPFINGLAHDAYLQGAQDFLGKQDAQLLNNPKQLDADTVIQGWVARDGNGELYIYSKKPNRTEWNRCWAQGGSFLQLLPNLLPDLTWESDPIEVEIIIKRKENG